MPSGMARALRTLATDPDQLPDAQPLKRKGVAVWAFRCSARGYVVKLYRHTGAHHRARNRLRSPARLYDESQRLRNGGVPLAPAVAAGSVHTSGGEQPFLVSELAAGPTLREALRDDLLTGAARRAALQAWGRTCGLTSAMGTLHIDPTLRNFILSEAATAPEPVRLVDIDGLRRLLWIPPPVQRFYLQKALLSLLRAGITGSEPITHADCVAFLEGFCRGRGSTSVDHWLPAVRRGLLRRARRQADADRVRAEVTRLFA